VEETVLYNRPGKSKTDYVESLHATIVRFPQKLPASDQQAMVWINLISRPTLQPICVKVTSLEKMTKTERSQRSSTIQQSQPFITVDSSDSDEDTPTVSNKKRKTTSRRPPASPKRQRLGFGGSYVEAMASAARSATKPAIDGPVKEAFRILLTATIKGLDGPELAEVQAEKDKLQRRYHKLQAAHVTVNAHLEAKEKALGDAVKAGKVERAKRKGLETQVAELKAQVLTLQNQASVATGAETAEADPTAERQKADLEKALFDKNVELADVKQQLDTIKQVLGGTK
jgi:ribosomal protein S17